MGSVAVARSQVETKEKVPGIISDISTIFTPDNSAPGAGPRHGGSEAHPAGAADPGAGLRAGHAAPGHHQAEAGRHEGGRQPVLSRGQYCRYWALGITINIIYSQYMHPSACWDSASTLVRHVLNPSLK